MSYFIYKKYLLLQKKNQVITLFARNSTILWELIGIHFKVYNGIRFINVFITESKVGHKFGEFSFTRKLGKFIHQKKKTKNKNTKIKKKKK